MLAIQISRERASRRRREAVPSGDDIAAKDQEQILKRRRLDHDLQVAMAMEEEEHHPNHGTSSRMDPCIESLPHRLDDRGQKERVGIWGFSRMYTHLFPSLLKRNFFVVQKHQATALHYDLRMQVNGGTFSWAIPKGFIGLGEGEETQHQAIETTVHGIAYTTVEGPDGHTHSSGVKCGAIVWDIGEYEIGRKHDREGSPGEEDELGSHEEVQLAIALNKNKTRGHRRTIFFTLKSGRKLSNHSFILKEMNTQYKSDGTEKISWMLMLQKGAKPLSRTPDVDLSVLSGKLLEDVCSDPTAPRTTFDDDI